MNMVSKDKINNFRLTVTFLQEGKSVVAYSPALDISTVGKNRQEAQNNFEEAVQLFLEDLTERGVIAQVLADLGWVKKKSEWKPPKENTKSIKIALATTA